MKYLYLSVFLLIFKSCSDKDAKFPIEVPEVVDSFTVFGLDYDAVLYAHFLDSVGDKIVAFHRMKHQLEFYHKDSLGDFHQKRVIPVPFGFGNHLVSFKDSKYAFTQGKNYVLFDTTDQTLLTYSAHDAKPVLQNNYQFLNEKTSPIFQWEDKIVLQYCNNHPGVIGSYLQDSIFSVYRIVEDSLVLVGNHHSKPKDILDKRPLAPSFIFKDRRSILLFSSLDSIYEYDFQNSTQKQYNIDNDYFKPNDTYDFTRKTEQKYITEYLSNNFEYKAILFNPVSNHFLLVFVAPYLEKQPIITHRKTYVLALTEDYKKIAYYDLGSNNANFASYISVPQKGIGIPINNPNDDSKITFRVYNF